MHSASADEEWTMEYPNICAVYLKKAKLLSAIIKKDNTAVRDHTITWFLNVLE